MLISKDYHALWLNSAALALAGGDLEVEGGVVVKDEDGEPTGVLYEEAAWQFKGRYARVPDEEYVDAMREGVQLAASRGLTAVHDINVIFVDERDDHVNPMGIKGLGEIGIVGVAAAIANAVYHATGKRVRDLPITLDKLQR